MIYAVPVSVFIGVLVCPESEMVYIRFGHAFDEQLKNRLCGENFIQIFKNCVWNFRDSSGRRSHRT